MSIPESQQGHHTAKRHERKEKTETKTLVQRFRLVVHPETSFCETAAWVILTSWAQEISELYQGGRGWCMAAHPE